MTDSCKFCDGANLDFNYGPCRTESDVRDYASAHGAEDPFEPCTSALAKLYAPKPHPGEDAFAPPPVSLTGLRLDALEALSASAAPAVSAAEGVKFDDGKLRFDLIPPDAMATVAAVLTYGALKYDDRNWELGMDRARLRAARARHENARLLGDAHDPETGLPHLAHEAACSIMELALFLREAGTDTAPNLPQHARTSCNQYGLIAVESGRVAASRKAVQRG